MVVEPIAPPAVWSWYIHAARGIGGLPKTNDTVVEVGAVLIKQEYDYGAIYGTTFILSFMIA